MNINSRINQSFGKILIDNSTQNKLTKMINESDLSGQEYKQAIDDIIKISKVENTLSVKTDDGFNFMFRKNKGIWHTVTNSISNLKGFFKILKDNRPANSDLTMKTNVKYERLINNLMEFSLDKKFTKEFLKKLLIKTIKLYGNS